MKKLLLIFIAALVSIVLFSCSNKRVKPTIVHGASLTPEQIAFYPFSLNTVYTFKNSTGGTLHYTCKNYVLDWSDSSNAPDFCGPHDDHCTYTLDNYLSIGLTSDSLPYNPIDLNIQTGYNTVNAQIYCFNTLMQMKWDNSSSCKMTKSPYNNLTAVSCIGSFTVNGRVYTDVIKTECTNSYYAVQSLYYSPTGGILQFTLNNVVWTLQ
jgi:hypothetical protein